MYTADVDIHEAVRQLRKALGWSQQRFATELGLSIRAVANYEQKRIPNPRSLARLESLAAEHEFPDLAVQFARELSVQMDIGGVTRRPISSLEHILHRAFNRCVIEDSGTKEAKRILELLEPYTKQIKKEEEALWKTSHKSRGEPKLRAEELTN